MISFCYDADMDYSKIITIEPGRRSGKPTLCRPLRGALITCGWDPRVSLASPVATLCRQLRWLVA